MEHSLLCTNQARYQGLIINDVPRLLSATSTQDMVFPNDDISISLHMNGPVPFINMRYLSDDDLAEGMHIHLTPEEAWDPHCLNSLNKGVPGLNLDLYEVFNDYLLESDINSILESCVFI